MDDLKESLKSSMRIVIKKACLDEFLTIKQVCERLGKTPAGILRAIKEERLIATKKGNKIWLIHKSDYEKFKMSKLK